MNLNFPLGKRVVKTGIRSARSSVAYPNSGLNELAISWPCGTAAIFLR